MEEKLSVLETLGAFKGFTSQRHWLVLNGTKHSSSKNKNHSNSQLEGKEEGNDIKTEEYSAEGSGEWNEEKTCLLDLAGGGAMERSIEPGGKVETEFSVEKTKLCLEDEGKNKDVNGNEKTDECDKSKSLIILSEPSTHADKILANFDESQSSGESEDNDDIPIEEKTPLTVQEWVNHLPLKDKSSKDTAGGADAKDDSQPTSTSPAEDSSLVAAKLSREASVQSNSSLDSLLDSRRRDPVEIFLNLGFGGVPGVNMENCRIPKRFLVPSECKGGDWNEFLRRELIQAQNFECSSLGFRGLSGPSYRRPSAIVANIMEKLRERTVGPPHPRSRFSAVAKKILNEKSVVNKLTSESPSVLSSDSRKFLQNQGKVSPEVPRRRIIFGQKSFAFARDGEFVEVEPSAGNQETKKESPASLAPASDGEDPAVFSSPDVLLKLRRSSLQKQKKVEEEPSADGLFYIVGKEEHPASEEPAYGSNKHCSKKIPRRFLSSSNLKALEREDNDVSEVMRLEVEKEIKTLSQQIKSISNQDLASVLKQVKQLRSRLESTPQDSNEL